MIHFTARELYEQAMETWGGEAQMLMVGEEALELGHAIFKWHRAWRKHNKYRDFDTQIELNKAIEHLIGEAMDVRLMLQQLEILQPGPYQDVFEAKFQAFADKVQEAQP